MSFGALGKCPKGHDVFLVADETDSLNPSNCIQCEPPKPIEPKPISMSEVKSTKTHEMSKCPRGHEIYLLPDKDGILVATDCEICEEEWKKYPKHKWGRCPNRHEIYQIHDGKGKYIDVECEVCFEAEKEKKKLEERKKLEEKKVTVKYTEKPSVIPEYRLVKTKNMTWDTNGKSFDEFQIAGPYPDGSFVVNGLAVVCKQYADKAENIPQIMLYMIVNKQVNDSLIIATFDANPEFWMAKGINGPGDLFEGLKGGEFRFPKGKDAYENCEHNINVLKNKYTVSMMVHYTLGRIGGTAQHYICEGQMTKMLHVKCDKDYIFSRA